jgi:hypothetical protein
VHNLCYRKAKESQQLNQILDVTKIEELAFNDDFNLEKFLDEVDYATYYPTT